MEIYWWNNLRMSANVEKVMELRWKTVERLRRRCGKR